MTLKQALAGIHKREREDKSGDSSLNPEVKLALGKMVEAAVMFACKHPKLSSDELMTRVLTNCYAKSH